MTRITLTDEQMKVLRQSKGTVQVCDPQGIVVGTADPEITPEFIAEMKRRLAAPGPRYSGDQVRAHLKALQDAWDREGGFDEIRMREILKEIRKAETA